MRMVLLCFAMLGVVGLSAAPASAAVIEYSVQDLDAAFSGAQAIDLSTCKVPSVVKLRDVVGIPPPQETVLVKTFRKETLPPVLAPAFAKPGVAGVTIAGRYVAVLQTKFRGEYDDVLKHELVHAYISLASPKPLPFWFQEGSAVHFSTDSGRRVYGVPSKDIVGLTEIRQVDLTEEYKQKLQSFHFLIERAGEKRFNKWYRNAVETGEVKPRLLLGLGKEAAVPQPKRTFPLVWALTAAVVVAGVVIAGFYVARRESDVW